MHRRLLCVGKLNVCSFVRLARRLFFLIPVCGQTLGAARGVRRTRARVIISYRVGYNCEWDLYNWVDG